MSALKPRFETQDPRVLASAIGGAAAPRMLFSTTNLWAADVALPRALRRAGGHVAMLAPALHPARGARLDGFFDAQTVRPVAALSRAIAEFRPDLLIPADERARRAMHVLFAQGTRDERSLVERSLGSPASFDILMSRQPSMAAIKEAGFPVPYLFDDASLEALETHFATGGGAIVLKVDGTWAGEGVRLVRSAADLRAVRRELRRRPVASGIKRLVLRHDGARLMDCLRGPARSLSAQAYIPGGRAGDLALFCRDGEVLATTMAEREAGYGEFGPSTIVRIVHHPVLEEAARRFVRRLGLSGFLGFDFVVDPGSGEPLVVEVNPRATGLASVRSFRSVSPASAAAAGFGACPKDDPEAAREVVAYFPKAWLEHPGDARLALCELDVPSDDPALMSALLGSDEAG